MPRHTEDEGVLRVLSVTRLVASRLTGLKSRELRQLEREGRLEIVHVADLELITFPSLERLFPSDDTLLSRRRSRKPVAA